MFEIDRMVEAQSVQEAIEALVRDPQAILISGGSDVLIKIREKKYAGCSLVSIHDMPALRGVRTEPDGALLIGAATTFAMLERDPLIRRHLPTLAAAAGEVGGPQLRNVATIGGNLCNGAPSADSAPTLLTLNAVLEIEGPGGARRLPLAQFYAGPGRVHLEHGEILTAIRIAAQDYAGFRGRYIKYAVREAMDIATLGCAVHVRVADGVIEDVRLAFGVAAPVPIRCPGAERAVRGAPVEEATFRRFGEAALLDVSPRDSWRASRAFRLHLLRELACRALRAASEEEVQPCAR